MWLQILLIFFALLFYLYYFQQGNSAASRHYYVTWLILMLIIQSGLRHLAVGDDTYAYFIFFEELKNETWQQVFNRFYDVYILNEGKDAGYFLLQKVFQVIFPSYRLFLIVIAIGFFWSLYRFIERYLPSLDMIFLSFCIYQALFYSFFSITGLRQVIATIATIVGVRLIEDKKLIQFVVIIFLASFIHKSVFIFLPFYFIADFKKSRLAIISSLCALPIIFHFSRMIAGFMVDISGSDTYRMYSESDYETGGAKNFLLFFAFASICLIISKTRNPDKVPNIVVNAMSLALIFIPLTWVDPSLMRVVQYFSIFLLVGLPIALKNMKLNRNIYKMLYLSLLILLLLTIIRRSYDYAFFWQDMQLPLNYF